MGICQLCECSPIHYSDWSVVVSLFSEDYGQAGCYCLRCIVFQRHCFSLQMRSWAKLINRADFPNTILANSFFCYFLSLRPIKFSRESEARIFYTRINVEEIGLFHSRPTVSTRRRIVSQTRNPLSLSATNRVLVYGGFRGPLQPKPSPQP